MDRRPIAQGVHGRIKKAPQAGGGPAQPRRRPGRGGGGGQPRHPPRPPRPQAPRPARREPRVRGANRRRQVGARQGARGVLLRLVGVGGGGHGAARHERVHGEARGGEAGRLAAGVRRARRGWSADGGGATAAARGGAARRGREGAPRRVRPAAAGARRRPPHRREGEDGGLQEHAHRHDDQHRQQPHRQQRRRRRRRRRQDQEHGDRRDEAPLPARVPEPAGRGDRVPATDRARGREDRRDHAGGVRREGQGEGDQAEGDGQVQGARRGGGIRTELRREAAEAGRRAAAGGRPRGEDARRRGQRRGFGDRRRRFSWECRGQEEQRHACLASTGVQQFNWIRLRIWEYLAVEIFQFTAIGFCNFVSEDTKY